MTTRTVPTTPRHDGRHCGHVARSESPTVKRAAILAECVSTVPGFTLPEGEAPAVVAVVEAILSGAPCDTLAYVATLAGWHGDAVAWADAQGAPFLSLPLTSPAALAYGGGLSFLTLAARTSARAL